MDAITLQAGALESQLNGEVKGRSQLEELTTAAQDFEAMMIEQMLKSMRKANKELSEDSLLGSREQEFWTEWQDSQVAMDISRGQGLGVADQIIDQVKKLEGIE